MLIIPLLCENNRTLVLIRIRDTYTLGESQGLFYRSESGTCVRVYVYAERLERLEQHKGRLELGYTCKIQEEHKRENARPRLRDSRTRAARYVTSKWQMGYDDDLARQKRYFIREYA